ncbi:MAG: hypothetical protein ACRERC_00350 [Candidatus Binatia bacterium]
MDMLRRRLGWTWLGLAIGVFACSPSRPPPLAPGTYAAVLGRVEIIRDGKVIGQGRTFTGNTMTRVLFANRATQAVYQVEVEEPTGAFMQHLPPGTYDINMGHYIWIFGTPFELEVAAPQEILYIGLLQVALFQRGSFIGGWARTSGGAIPIPDNDYQVLDESERLVRPLPDGPPVRIQLVRQKPPAQ